MATMAEETRDHIEKLATQQAYQQGRRDADVDARLLSHDRHLTRLDEYFDKFQRTADGRFDAFDDKLDEVIKAQGAREAVEADREDKDDKQTQRLFSRRTIQLAFGTIVVMLLGVMVSVIALIASSPHH